MKYWQFAKTNLVNKILPKPHVSLVIIFFFFEKFYEETLLKSMRFYVKHSF